MRKLTIKLENNETIKVQTKQNIKTKKEEIMSMITVIKNKKNNLSEELLDDYYYLVFFPKKYNKKGKPIGLNSFLIGTLDKLIYVFKKIKEEKVEIGLMLMPNEKDLSSVENELKMKEALLYAQNELIKNNIMDKYEHKEKEEITKDEKNRLNDISKNIDKKDII